MLGRPREAHHSTDERVVATVSAPVARREQLVETMGRPLAPTGRHIKAQRPQTRRGHGNQQRALALATRGEIGEPGAHKLVTGEAGGHALPTPIVSRSEPHRRCQRRPRPTPQTEVGRLVALLVALSVRLGASRIRDRVTVLQTHHDVIH